MPWLVSFPIVFIFLVWSIWPLLVWAVPARIAAPFFARKEAQRSRKAVQAPAPAMVGGREKLSNGPTPRQAFIACVVALVGTYGAMKLVKIHLVDTFSLRSSFSAMEPTVLPGDVFVVAKYAAIERADVVAFAYPCNTAQTHIARAVAMAGDRVELRCGTLFINGVPAELEVESRDIKHQDSGGEETSLYRETIDGTSYLIYGVDNVKKQERAKQANSTRNVAVSREFPGLLLPSCHDTEDGVGEGVPEPTGDIVQTSSRAMSCEPQRHFVVPDGHFFALGDHREQSLDSRYWGPVPMRNAKGVVRRIGTSRDRQTDEMRFGRWGKPVH